MLTITTRSQKPPTIKKKVFSLKWEPILGVFMDQAGVGLYEVFLNWPAHLVIRLNILGQIQPP